MSMRKPNLYVMSWQNFFLKMNINTLKQQTKVFKIDNITCIHIQNKYSGMETDLEDKGWTVYLVPFEVSSR